MRFAREVAICALSFLAGCAEAPIASQSTPPTETQGLSAAPLWSLDLGEEIDSTKGRPLRMRKITLAPGQGFAEGKATTHWAENRGSVPAVWIAVDIPKEP